MKVECIHIFSLAIQKNVKISGNYKKKLIGVWGSMKALARQYYKENIFNTIIDFYI